VKNFKISKTQRKKINGLVQDFGNYYKKIIGNGKIFKFLSDSSNYQLNVLHKSKAIKSLYKKW
jgi:hypothetical protein